MLRIALRRMSRRSLHRTLATFLLTLAAAGCGADPVDVPVATDLERGRAYVDDSDSRRAALEGSLVNRDNTYAQLRLERYTEDNWGALPIWNPPTHPVETHDIDAEPPEPNSAWQALAVENVAWTQAALVELGREVFHNYPMQVEPAMREALGDAAGPDEFGLWRVADRIGGLVWVELPDSVEPVMTCSTCHGSLDSDGGLVSGLANAGFDYGRVLDTYYGRVSENGRWGPGRVDVTPDEVENPTVIPDLRAVRFQTHLNRAATLRNDLIALAVRLETGMITANGEVARPPRELVFALALYLYSLGETLPELGVGVGRAVYDSQCASCHQPPGLSGSPIRLEDIQTDPTIGQSPARTTGFYQTTTLRGVGDRGLLLANGAVPDLATLLDPARDAPGHTYGFDLSDEERAALLELLGAL